MIQTILIVLVVLWLLGIIALPTSASLVNILLALVIIWVILKIFGKVS